MFRNLTRMSLLSHHVEVTVPEGVRCQRGGAAGRDHGGPLRRPQPSSARAADTWARLACRSASAICFSSSRTELAELTAAKLCAGSSSCCFKCSCTSAYQEGAALAGQGLVLLEDLSQRFGLVQDPGVHGLDQGVAADEVHLQREDAEQQVTVGSPCGRRCGHEAISFGSAREKPLRAS